MIKNAEEDEEEDPELAAQQMKIYSLDLTKAFEKYGDTDGDGKISYEEFEDYMQTNDFCIKFLDVLAKTANKLRDANDNFGGLPQYKI